MYNEDELKQYDWMKIPRPSQDRHVEDTWEHPLSEKLEQANTSNWRQEGNKLTCDTQFGVFTQILPTNLILIGEENGLPKFKDIAKQ